jgi:hypothetical protein
MEAMAPWNRHPDPLVLCCYVNLHPETEFSVRDNVPNPVFRDTSGDQLAFGRTIQEFWTGKQDLVTIEQDIVITPGVLPSFAGCNKDWCVYGYQSAPRAGFLYRGLGCTKFSARLQRRFPFRDFVVYEMTWKNVDAYISRLLWTLNDIQPHLHGIVEHKRDYRDDPYNAWTQIAEEIQPDGRIFLYENDQLGRRTYNFLGEKEVKDWKPRG